jgi:hypothetical protein
MTALNLRSISSLESFTGGAVTFFIFVLLGELQPQAILDV